MDMSLGNVQIKHFQLFFFLLQKGKSIFYCRKETEFVGESRSLQTLTSLLLWNKKSPQTEKIFLAKIMSIPGTGNTSHFFVLLLWCFLSLFLDFPFLRESTCTHQALKYLNKEKALFFRIESFATSNIPEMSDNSNCFEQRILACSISQMQWSGMNHPSQTLCHSISFLTQLAERISVCWFTTLNTSLHESTLQLWKDGRHLSLIQNIYYFIMCPLTTKKGIQYQSACSQWTSVSLHSERNQADQTFLYWFGKGISKMTTLRPPALLSARALHGLRCLISCFLVHKAGGGGAGASSPSSCNAGLKQIQNYLHVLKISFPCTPALPPKSLWEG